MLRRYKVLVPQSIGEILDKLGWMTLRSPTFTHDEFPGLDIDVVFFELNEGLSVVRKDLGEDSYNALMALSRQMRIHFDADPDDKTQDSIAGRLLIEEMAAILSERRTKQIIMPD